MDHKEAWESYVRYTDATSEHSRTLAFAGVGVCWVLKGSGELTPLLIHAIGYFVCFFTADILHYFLAALMHRWWIRREERRLWNPAQGAKSLDGTYIKPWWVDSPAFYCFMAKVIFLLTAYVHIGISIFGGTPPA